MTSEYDHIIVDLENATREVGGLMIEVDRLTRERAEALIELDKARAETARHVEVMIKMGLWRKSPCVVCEYDGPEYFQSDGPHYCAGVAAALEERARR